MKKDIVFLYGTVWSSRQEVHFIRPFLCLVIVDATICSYTIIGKNYMYKQIVFFCICLLKDKGVT